MTSTKQAYQKDAQFAIIDFIRFINYRYLEANMEQQTQTEQKITRTMTIGEVTHQYPSIVETLMAHGVHCVGCGASYDETIEQGLSAHGMSDADIDNVVKELNEAIPLESGSSDKLIITEKAAEKLKEILKSKNKVGSGLRIQVIAGGCSGHQYAFDFEDKAQEGDNVIEISGVKFYVDAESIQLLRGAKVDYVDSLQGAGFKISNPNAEHTCGCGQSFH